MEIMMPNKEKTENYILAIAKQEAGAWAQTLETGDAAVVADGYTEDATFHPTKSGDLKRGQKGAEEYFAHFLESHPVCAFESIDAFASEDGKTIVFFGKYSFELDDEEQKRIKVRGDYTFVSEPVGDGERKRSHHHSSVDQSETKNFQLEEENIQYTIDELEQVFKNFFENQTDEKIENMVIQLSNDQTIAIISILHSGDGQNRSTVVLKKENDAWHVKHHHFSPRPQ